MATRTAARATSASKRSSKKKRWKMILWIALILSSTLFIAASVYAVNRLNHAAKIVPTLPVIMEEMASRPSEIYSLDGKLLFSIDTEYRSPVKIQDVPKVVIDTTLAAEDIRFYSHGGVDAIAIGRVVYDAIRQGGRPGRGGSTLTMQLAKRVYTSSERSFDRKMDDMALAIMIERIMTKDQIMELYLNQVFYGAGAYGIAAAANVYFGKRLDQLTLSEAALLARCVRRPSDENPFADLEAAVNNRNVVLLSMLKEGLITQEEYETALSEKVKLRQDRSSRVTARKLEPYFVDYVLREIRQKMPDIDITKGGYRVETTIDTRIQSAAEEEVRDSLRRYRGWRVGTGAAVIVDREGKILAMVGGPSYERNQFNYVTQGRRQPGSSFKPFVYATAFQNGVLGGSYSSVDNGPLVYRGTNQSVQGGGPKGQVSVSSAMAFSYNRAAVWTIERVGSANVVYRCRQDFGFRSNLASVPSLALGSSEVTMLEMAEAYSVFMLRGRRIEPFGIRRILDHNGMSVYVAETDPYGTGISPDTAEKIDDLLRGVVRGGTGSAAANVANARGKTGTTNDNKDVWFAGYTDQLIGIVWFANPVKRSNGSFRWMSMSEAAMGGKVSAPTWSRIMRRAQEFVKEVPVKKDDGASTRRARVQREDPEPPPTVEPDPPVQDDAEPQVTPPPTQDRPKQDPATDPASSGALTTGGTTGQTTGGAQATTGGGQSPPPPRTEDPPRNDGGTVSVEICAETGQRASVYCPERVTRRYKAGQEPRGRCPIHGRR